MTKQNPAPKELRVKLFARIRELEENPEIWQLRTICTIDLSEGLDTYVEHLTIDVDHRYVSQIDDYYYLPVGWRERESFLELDCQTNSGDSMQLMPLYFRQDYMEWKFWDVCYELGLVPGPTRICECLRERLSKVVADPEGAQAGSLGAMPHAKCSRKWKELEREPIPKELLAKMKTQEPLIFRVRARRSASCDADISILKVSERKTLFGPKDPHLQRYRSDMWGTISSFSANTNKVVAPRDMRLVRGHCYEVVADSNTKELEALTVEPFADGNWLHLRREFPPPALIWVIEFRPRRGFLYKPGRTTIILSLLATISWMFLFKQSFLSDCQGSFVSSGDVCALANKREIVKTVMSSIPFGLLFAYYLTRLPLFQQSQERSFLYDVWTRPHYKLLAWTIGLTVIFPFLNVIDYISVVWTFFGVFVSIADVIQLLIIAFQALVLITFNQMCFKSRPRVD